MHRLPLARLTRSAVWGLLCGMACGLAWLIGSAARINDPTPFTYDLAVGPLTIATITKTIGNGQATLGIGLGSDWALYLVLWAVAGATIGWLRSRKTPVHSQNEQIQ